MILTREEILKEIEKGNIVIEPFDIKYLGPASYDVALDNEIRIFKDEIYEIDIGEIAENTNIFNQVTEKIKLDDYYPLKPGELVIGITKEKITLSPGLCAWIQGRSRFARCGLMVHVSASFIQPGVSNKQVFEIYNASRNIIKLRPGVRIAQIIFQRCVGKAKYKGIFKNQLKL